MTHQQWVANQLGISMENLGWQPLSGDASFRRYFRCRAGERSFMFALAPPEKEKNREFVAVAGLLGRSGVLAPKVVAVDFDHGYILQQDFGDTLLRQKLDDTSVDYWYRKAMVQIVQMLAIPPQELAFLPPYDEAALALELSYFRTWFLEAMLGYPLTPDEEVLVNDFFALLLESALEQPCRFVHRDYHSRNIMVTAEGELATIDFQDALRGPFTYDLVSLLRDCYVVWPESQVAGWVEVFRQQLVLQGVTDVDSARFKRWFDLMGLQRHIKVLGIFARLSLRDGKHGYLNDLPTVVNYVRTVAAVHADAAAFLGWFDRKILPLAKQQPWGEKL